MPPKKDPKTVEQAPKEPEPQPQPFELTGYGRFEYLSGVVYEGNWMMIKGKKMKHGYGKLIIPTTEDLPIESYEGDWQEDKMQGFGIYHYPDGSIYHGEWKDNKHSGQGVFEFPNGTMYSGQWSNHLMSGAGEFTDHLGRKWKGEYRKGIFDSRGQRNLFKQLAINQRESELKVEVQSTIEKILSILREQGKQLYRITPFFFNEEVYSNYAVLKSIKFDDRTSQQWIELFQRLKGGNYIVLRDRKESTVLPPQNLIAEQMQGPGQVVQITNDGVSCAFLSVGGSNWVLVELIRSK